MTIYATSPSLADVQSAISVANPGDTVIVPAGSATWLSTLTITKSILLFGDGIGLTNITCGFSGTKWNFLIDYQPSAATIAADAPFRISGFTIDMGAQAVSPIRLYNMSSTAITKNRIDHIRFITLDSAAYLPLIEGMVFGVCDNCDFPSRVNFEVFGANETSWTYFTATRGGADNFFFEDNNIVQNGYNTCFGSGAGGRYCARYNTIDASGFTDYAFQLADIHGSMYTGGNLSSMIVEIYNNTINASGKGVILGDFRGGQGFCYNNIVNAATAQGPEFREELMDTICPPANNVIDGRPQHVNDSYAFNNRLGTRVLTWTPNGTVDYAAGQTDESNSQYYPPAEPYRVVPTINLDFWVESGTNHTEYTDSPDVFDGSKDVGVGLLSARPATCTMEGVGWWATDTQHLYRWHNGSPGYWEDYYHPYTYPHPLRTESYPDPGNPTVLTTANAAFVLTASAPVLIPASDYTLVVAGASVYLSSKVVLLSPIEPMPWDIKLGRLGAEVTLPALNWPSGSSPEMPVGTTAYVDQVTLANGSARYNFRTYSPRKWSLEWERLSEAEVTIFNELAAIQEPLHYQNKWVGADWHWVIITACDPVPVTATFTTGTPFWKLKLSLEEII